MPRLAVLILASLVLGCRSSSDPSKELKSVVSWAETARMVAEERLAKTVTRTYAENALDAVHEELGKVAKTMRSESLDAASREPILSAIHEIDETVQRMRGMVEADDDAGLFHESEQLIRDRGELAAASHDEASRR
jgi:hypothetical protein